MQPRRGAPHGEADMGSAGAETVDSQFLLLFSENLNGSSFAFFKRKKQAQDNLGSLSRAWPYPTASGCHDNDPPHLLQFPVSQLTGPLIIRKSSSPLGTQPFGCLDLKPNAGRA